jgi:hypothetical protein
MTASRSGTGQDSAHSKVRAPGWHIALVLLGAPREAATLFQSF